MENHQRCNAFYRGHVQGVGFRITVQRLAAGHPVVGFVRNLADGRVELVAEGSRTHLDDFLTRIADVMGEKITDVQVQFESPTEEFTSFEIQT